MNKTIVHVIKNDVSNNSFVKFLFANIPFYSHLVGIQFENAID